PPALAQKGRPDGSLFGFLFPARLLRPRRPGCPAEKGPLRGGRRVRRPDEGIAPPSCPGHRRREETQTTDRLLLRPLPGPRPQAPRRQQRRRGPPRRPPLQWTAHREQAPRGGPGALEEAVPQEPARPRT